MPARLGDRGVFVCGPDDIAPWEREPVRKAADAGVVSEHKRAPARTWLVLALCPHCSPAHGGYYCREHNDRNWWITRSGLGRPRQAPEKENAPGAAGELTPGTPNA
jgi:hypothetical protein